MFELYNKIMLNIALNVQYIVLLKPYMGCVKEFYYMIYTIKLCNKIIHNVRSKKKCLCPSNILHQRYNILFFDDLSITWYNKFHQIRDLSFRGGTIGAPVSNLLDWSLTYRAPPFSIKSEHSLALQAESDRDLQQETPSPRWSCRIDSHSYWQGNCLGTWA